MGVVVCPPRTCARAPATLVLALSLLSAAGVVQAQVTYNSVYEALSATPNFASLVSAIQVAGLDQALSDPELTAVVFAPDSTALANTLQNFPGAATVASNRDAANQVISYHVIPSTTVNPTLNFTSSSTTLSTLLSSLLPPNVSADFQAGTLANLTFKLLSDNQVYAAALPPGGTFLLNTSIIAGKSRIYPVSGGMLIPPSKVLTVSPPPVNLTITEALANNANFSLLLTLINSDATLRAFVNDPDQAVTVFAPNNDAITSTLSILNIQAESLIGTAVAQRIVLNHIIPLRPFTSTAIPAGTVSIRTASQDPSDNVTITSTGGLNPNVTVQGTRNLRQLNVIAANITAGKSVVHMIDGVILPDIANITSSPPPSTTPTLSPPQPVGGVISPSPSIATPPSSLPPPPPNTAFMPQAPLWSLAGCVLLALMALQ